MKSKDQSSSDKLPKWAYRVPGGGYVRESRHLVGSAGHREACQGATETGPRKRQALERMTSVVYEHTFVAHDMITVVAMNV